MSEFEEKLEAFEKALEECAMAEFDTGENFVDEQEKREWDEMKAELHEKEQQAKAALTAHVAALTVKLDKLKPNRDDYRLTEADLERIVNEAGAANDLSDCVKDLLLAHYQFADLQQSVAAKDAEIERLKAELTLAKVGICTTCKELCANFNHPDNEEGVCCCCGDFADDDSVAEAEEPDYTGVVACIYCRERHGRSQREKLERKNAELRAKIEQLKAASGELSKPDTA